VDKCHHILCFSIKTAISMDKQLFSKTADRMKPTFQHQTLTQVANICEFTKMLAKKDYICMINKQFRDAE